MKTRIVFVVETDGPLSSDDKESVREYAIDTVANSIDDAQVLGITCKFEKEVA